MDLGFLGKEKNLQLDDDDVSILRKEKIYQRRVS